MGSVREPVGCVDVRTVVDPPEMEDLRLPARDEQRLVLVQSGVKRIESGAGGGWRAAQYQPGAVGMTAPGRPTRLRWRASSEQVRTLHVVIPGEHLRRVAREEWGADELRPLDALVVDDPLLPPLLTAIGQVASGGGQQAYVDSAVQFLLVHLLTRHGGLRAPAPVGRADTRIALAHGFMRAHLAEPLTLADVAAAAGLSPYHFVRVHKAATGVTPMRWLTQVRVRAAQRLLGNSPTSITEIAYACGFSSPSHLATTFTRQVGVTPSRFRADHQVRGRSQAGGRKSNRVEAGRDGSA